jgi:putative tryptophan/tyrosine transport system substrate-binding protein
MWSSVIGCLVMLILSLLAVPLTADAQPPGKVPRIGLLIPGSASGFSSRTEVFRQGLPEYGWMEGQNVAIEYRSAEGRAERFVDLAAELVRLPVDVLVTWA